MGYVTGTLKIKHSSMQVVVCKCMLVYAAVRVETIYSPLLHSSLFFDNVLSFIESLLWDPGRFVLSHLVCHLFKMRLCEGCVSLTQAVMMDLSFWIP